jgi:methionyl-tRNA formyltransferase
MRIVILTSEYTPTSNLAVQTLIQSPLLRKHKIKVVGIVATETIGFGQKGVATLQRLWQKFDVFFFLRFTTIIFVQYWIIRWSRWFAAKSSRSYRNLDELAETVGAKYLEVREINAVKTVTAIKKLQPDLLVSCLLLQKAGAELLALPTKGAINFHPALTHQHRGVFASFWTIFHNFKSGGATVHRMTSDFDAGEILIRKRFFVSPADSVHCLNLRAAKLGGKLLARAIAKIAKGEKQPSLFKQKLGRLLTLPSETETREFLARGKSLIKWEDLFQY